MKKDLILVIGASGTVGSELVSQLKTNGYSIRATTSKAVSSSDSDTVHVNLATGDGITAAFEDVDKAFLMSPPGYADQYALVSPLIQEAKRRGLKKVVLMTAMGANASDSTPFRRAELDLEKSGLNYNIIRPNWFLQNFNTFWLQSINEHSKILLPAGKAKASFIDARDIASVAAKLLTTNNFDGKDFDLTGPEAVDHDQVAGEISKASGRKITYQEISPDELRQSLLKAGAPKDYTEFLLLIMGYLKEGYNARLTSNVKEITGHAPKSLSDYVKDYKNYWTK